MREIIFRGKDHFTGEWIEGYYSKVGFGNGFFDAIVKFDGGSTQPHRVDPETIGQFTGLLDKDGAKIFEGDFVKLNYGIPPTFDILRVEWRLFGWFLSSSNPGRTSSYLEPMFIDDITVIGNVHEQKN